MKQRKIYSKNIFNLLIKEKYVYLGRIAIFYDFFFLVFHHICPHDL